MQKAIIVHRQSQPAAKENAFAWAVLAIQPLGLVNAP
jgi:hypothetical protein